MVFLFRCVFWLGLVFVMAPILFPPEKGAAPAAGTAVPAHEARAAEEPVRRTPQAIAPQAIATHALSGETAAGQTADQGGAWETLGRIVSFCDQQADICNGAVGVLSRFGDVLGAGIDYVSALVGSEPAAAPLPSDPALRGTLTAGDREEPWHGTGRSPPPQG
ncbi:hypothetical protein SAMN02745172_02870 [Pseudoxanthobacter soli DSM 19599]|uniref:Uncharacterized protein n=1 Tax=Pseudoxanthobacter soli DSM 19599 TaxID=1123029 RepID=A0A1M7ZMU4_9HYPH|nr:hypothetical protein [Pseudoxanthobacter soli]SHO66215.1 hypothetical protein SAMN02745172_02870 [Pseudoxanthobacter soli DSM 19599]